MSIYQVAIKRSAEKEIAALPISIIEKIYSILGELAKEPRPSGVKKLSGFKDLYRVRVNDYRLIYSIKDNVLQVLVLKVGHRKDVYR